MDLDKRQRLFADGPHEDSALVQGCLDQAVDCSHSLHELDASLQVRLLATY